MEFTLVGAQDPPEAAAPIPLLPEPSVGPTLAPPALGPAPAMADAAPQAPESGAAAAVAAPDSALASSPEEPAALLEPIQTPLQDPRFSPETIRAALGQDSEPLAAEAPSPAVAPSPDRPAPRVDSRKPVRYAKTRKEKPMTRNPAKKSRSASKNKRNPIVRVRVKTPTASKARVVSTPPPQELKAETGPSAQVGFPSNVNDSRQAFVVLAWFEFLLRRIPAKELPYLIDEYRRIGWIDDKLHAWFIRMAHGVGGTRTKAGETQFARQGARGLVTIHKETLRFLKQLHVAPPKAPIPENGVLRILRPKA